MFCLCTPHQFGVLYVEIDKDTEMDSDFIEELQNIAKTTSNERFWLWITEGGALPDHGIKDRNVANSMYEDGLKIREFRCAPPYRTFVASQRDITPAISALFFSSIIMWPLPWMPASASLIQTGLTPAC